MNVSIKTQCAIIMQSVGIECAIIMQSVGIECAIIMQSVGIAMEDTLTSTIYYSYNEGYAVLPWTVPYHM